MPYSVMLLDIKSNGISAELQFPLKEFQVVFPDEDLDSNYTTLIDRKNKWLDEYLLSHMSITDSIGNKWNIHIQGKSVTEGEQNLTGKYHELVFHLRLQPPAGSSPRHFIMHYDAIMHQLVTHKLWIKIRSDWDGGLTAKDSTDADLGILGVNFTDNTIPPVIVNLDEGSNWNGFKAMVSLGIEHIAAGTDHLLFLLVLLLPATLIVENKRWTKFGGTKYSLLRLFKIATAFTIGHSITLVLGALSWVKLPQQPVEIFIAVTILITAVHALKPLFYNKEIYIATGFGLIHGLAFATVLSNLHLEAGKMALSILGFNAGIELMQLFVIIVTVPWLMVLSDKPIYTWVRITGAVFAIVAALAWTTERILLQPNFISDFVQKAADKSKWIVFVLACLVMLTSWTKKFKRRRADSGE
jgi:hypothetical protein